MQKRKRALKSASMLAWLKANGRMVLVGVLAILLMGNFVVAQTSDINFWDSTAKYLAQILAVDMKPDGVSLSADIADSNYLTTKRPATVVPYENVWVENELEVGATTTLQEVRIGTRFSEDLDFSAGNTSTPGSLFSLVNTGSDKICSKVEVDISAGTNGTASGAFTIDFSTSTSATAFSGGSGQLIASSTVATATALLINSIDQEGTSGMDSWTWGTGVALNGNFDMKTVGYGLQASSTAYSTRTGKVYMNCHTK